MSHNKVFQILIAVAILGVAMPKTMRASESMGQSTDPKLLRDDLNSLANRLIKKNTELEARLIQVENEVSTLKIKNGMYHSYLCELTPMPVFCR